jgi:hypothetical protein
MTLVARRVRARFVGRPFGTPRVPPLVLALTVAIVARRVTATSWALQQPRLHLVDAAGGYLASFDFRALVGLFPARARPNRSRRLASCRAGAASGAVLPFRSTTSSM